MSRINSVIALVLLVYGFLPAQDWDALDSFMRKHTNRMNLPGAALTVVRGDEIVFSREYGTGITTKQPYYIGSLSKSLTATAVMQLVERGALSLDSRVRGLLPEIIFNGPEAEQLEVEHLLRHRSGLVRRQGFIPLPTLAELKERPFELTLRFVPGTQEEYSNLNYALLGLIIERVSGQPYENFLQENLFRPLLMNQSFADREAAREAGMEEGHQYWFGLPLGGGTVNYKETAVPAGFIISSTEDMSRFLSAHLLNGRFQGRAILTSETVQRMHRPPALNTELREEKTASGRAIGWMSGAWNDHRILHKEGATANSYAFMALLPEDSTAFIFMTNVNAFNPIVNSVEGIPQGILNILTGEQGGDYFPYNLIVLLGFGVLLLLSVIDLGSKLIGWFRAGMPMRSGEARGPMLRLVFFKLVVPVGIAWALLFYFDIPLNSLLAIQPDIGWTIVISIFTGFVGGFLEHFIKVASEGDQPAAT